MKRFLLFVACACIANAQIVYHQLRITPLSSSSPSVGEIDFASKDNSHFVGFAAPDTLSGDTLWRLPSADGSANQAICTDGSKNLFFCSGGTGGTPGGPSTAVQYNNSGSLGGSANLEWNNSLQKLTVTGISSTAGFDVQNGFIQSEGGIVSNAGGVWNGFNSSTDGIGVPGVSTLNGTGNKGGYHAFAMLNYNPYGSGSVCHDGYGNIVGQPTLLNNAGGLYVVAMTGTTTAGSTTVSGLSATSGSLSSIGSYFAIEGSGIPYGDFINPPGYVSGSNSIVLNVAATASGTVTMYVADNTLYMWNAPSPIMPGVLSGGSGSCGVSILPNSFTGINTNGYVYSLAGHATSSPYYNSIQSLIGGVIGRALFTSDYLNGPGLSTCSSIGSCGGGYYNTNGSNGVPTPLTGDMFHGGAFYYDNSLAKMRLYDGSTWHSVMTDASTFVNSLSSGSGISVSGSTGSVTISNTGVTSLSVSSPLSITGSTGSLSISCSSCGSGAVSSVSGGTGVTVSPTTGAVNVSIGQSVATSATPTFAGMFSSSTVNCTLGSSSSSNCFQQQSGTFAIQGNGNAQFQVVVANQLQNTGWNFNNFGSGTWNASAYYANNTAGVTSTTCSQFTKGICTAP